MFKAKNNSGYSLVEIMVVVAIIGIIAMIGIPQYNMFQAKAKQKEGFALMSGYFAAAQQTIAYFDIYPGNFIATGFNPHGQLGYRVRIEDNPNDINTQDNDDGCIATWADCNCGGACIEYRKAWEEKPAGAVGLRLGPQTVVTNCAPLAPLGVTDTTFSFRVAGVINTKAVLIDRWGMDQTKQIINCQDGLK